MHALDSLGASDRQRLLIHPGSRVYQNFLCAYFLSIHLQEVELSLRNVRNVIHRNGSTSVINVSYILGTLKPLYLNLRGVPTIKVCCSAKNIGQSRHSKLYTYLEDFAKVELPAGPYREHKERNVGKNRSSQSYGVGAVRRSCQH